MRRFVRNALALAGCIVALAAGAEERTFYKSVLPNGRVVYGDAPAAEAKRSDKITVRTDTLSSRDDAEAAKRALQMSRAQLLKDAAARAARLAQLDVEIAAAYDGLKAAETQREAGREFQEGDRQGRRIRPRYVERQHKLETALRQARRRLDQLIAERAGLL